LGQLVQAKTEFKRVLAINPRHTSSILALALIAESQDSKEELKDLSQMLSVLDEDALELLKPTSD
jgi:Tfp pilus assembly protein PilF